MPGLLEYLARPLGQRTAPFAWERMLLWAMIIACFVTGDDLAIGSVTARALQEVASAWIP